MRISQKGAAPVLILVAVVGLVAFLAIATSAPLQDTLLSSVFPKPASNAATAVPNCWPTSGSGFAGTLAGQPNAIWCFTDYSDGPSTAIKGNNSWVDDFNHGLSFGKFDNVNYTDFPITGSLCKSQLFRHGNHWMRDIAGHDQGGEGSCGWDFGAAMMRPNATFTAENGMLVIEADAATRVSSYGSNLFWPEFVITTADRPTAIRSNGTYVYEAFPNHWTLGCRLQNDGGFTCALLDDGPGGDTPSRVYELSHFQCGNSEDSPHPGSVYGCKQKYGGLPANLPAADASYSRNCEGLDPDVNCRDRWRWEITKNRLTWYVNGKKYMEHWDFEPAGQAATNQLLTRPVYVYFGEFMYKLGKPARMHWDRIAINPKDANGNIVPASTAETFCFGQPLNTCGATPLPSQTPNPSTPAQSPSPAASPSPAPSFTPAPAGTYNINFDDRSGQNQALNGQYPQGLINWGTGGWWHSAPFKKFTTKSVSFSNQNLTSGSFSFTTPRRLVSLKAYNGGTVASTVTISCSGQPTKSVSVPVDTIVDIATGWNGTCSSVTITSTNGWNTNFDDMVVDSGASASPSSQPNPSSSTKPGDADNNGKVDIFDLNIVLTNFGRTGTNLQGDLDQNNRVDIFDYNIVLSNFGK